jgi:hypothetical protein
MNARKRSIYHTEETFSKRTARQQTECEPLQYFQQFPNYPLAKQRGSRRRVTHDGASSDTFSWRALRSTQIVFIPIQRGALTMRGSTIIPMLSFKPAVLSS